MTAEFLPNEFVYAIKELEELCDRDGSNSAFFEYGSLGYKESIRHFLASSSEVAQLALQPRNARDLSEMVKLISKYRIPFAVKGGGHGMAPGYSSTSGIHISMSRFSRVRYQEETQLVEIGAGCLWDQVYSKLAPTGRNVIGGASANGVGVAGWLLGGGYSLKSNRYGLGIDSVVEYEIITPDGELRRVTKDGQYKDLFQALRGGGNNFGIVTKFILKTYPQNDTYGALITVLGDQAENVKTAILKFLEEEDRPQACIIPAFRHTLVPGVQKVEYNISIFCVFDGPKPKKNIPFQEFSLLGDVWMSDPAGWILGQTELSVTDRSKCKLVPIQPDTPKGETDSVPESEAGPFSEMSFHRFYNVQSDGVITNNDGYESEEPDTKKGGTDFKHQEIDLVEDESDTEEDGPDLAANIGPSPVNVELVANAATSITTSMFESEEDETRSSSPQPVLKRIKVTKPIDKMGEQSERGRFACLMVSTYNKPLLDVMATQAEELGKCLLEHRGLAVVIDAWPVHPRIFDDSPPGAAFPHKRGEPYGPLLVYLRWQNAEDDAFWIKKINDTLDTIRAVALAHGLTSKKPALYNNPSMETVPAYKIYRKNMGWLKQVKAKYDPADVMGLAGGHKIPLPDASRPKDN